MIEPTEVLREENNGFTGLYWKCPAHTVYKTVIVVMGDTADDIMDKAAAKWLTKFHNVNALTLALKAEGDDDTGLRAWPLEKIEKAVRWLVDDMRMDDVGIMGISMQAVVALKAATLIPEIDLAIAFAPADFVPWGFHQGPLGKYKKAEYPSGTSLLSWRGEEVPYLSSHLEGEDYWKFYLSEKKKYHEIHTMGFFAEAEKRAGVRPEEFIPVEKINGPVIFVGAEDDSMWDSAKYIRRMHERLMKNRFKHDTEAFIYTYGTHLLVPERLLYSAFPIGGGLVQRMYKSGKKHGSACRAAREELEDKFTTIFREW